MKTIIKNLIKAFKQLLAQLGFIVICLIFLISKDKHEV